MGKKKSYRGFKIILGSIFLLVAVILGGNIIRNQFSDSYEKLSDRDRLVLNELEQYFAAYKDTEIWYHYDLSKQPLLLVDGRGGHAYLVNPDQPVKNITAKKIEMAKDSSITVYRIAAMSPSLYHAYLLAQFSGWDETYRICGNEVFYFRYEEANYSELEDNSGHFITYLTHEAFHNLGQKTWADEMTGSRFETDSLTEQDYDILEQQFEALYQMQMEMSEDAPDHEVLQQACQEYIQTSEQLKESNPQFFSDYIDEETFEGTANYIGIKSSEAAGYQFGVGSIAHYDENVSVSDYPLNEVIPYIRDGQMSASTLSSTWPYATGALLCEVLDELENETWQQQLSEQSEEAPVTLYDLIREHDM